MRQIKFRAYDLSLNKWVATGFHIIGEVTMFGIIDQYVHENPVKGMPTLERYGDIEVTQWTGLVDSKGTDIYEGDILTSEHYNPKSYLCQFIEGGFCLTDKDQWMMDINMIQDSKGIHFDVTSNKYDSTGE